MAKEGALTKIDGSAYYACVIGIFREFRNRKGWVIERNVGWGERGGNKVGGKDR